MSVRVPTMSQEAKYLHRKEIIGMLFKFGLVVENYFVAISYLCRSQTLGCADILFSKTSKTKLFLDMGGKNGNSYPKTLNPRIFSKNFNLPAKFLGGCQYL